MTWNGPLKKWTWKILDMIKWILCVIIGRQNWEKRKIARKIIRKNGPGKVMDHGNGIVNKIELQKIPGEKFGQKLTIIILFLKWTEKMDSKNYF